MTVPKFASIAMSMGSRVGLTKIHKRDRRISRRLDMAVTEPYIDNSPGLGLRTL